MKKLRNILLPKGKQPQLPATTSHPSAEQSTSTPPLATSASFHLVGYETLFEREAPITAE
jgi:hypothetical protein